MTCCRSSFPLSSARFFTFTLSFVIYSASSLDKCGFQIVEFYHLHHLGPNAPREADQENASLAPEEFEFFKFEKVMKKNCTNVG